MIIVAINKIFAFHKPWDLLSNWLNLTHQYQSHCFWFWVSNVYKKKYLKDLKKGSCLLCLVGTGTSLFFSYHKFDYKNFLFFSTLTKVS